MILVILLCMTAITACTQPEVPTNPNATTANDSTGTVPDDTGNQNDDDDPAVGDTPYGIWHCNETCAVLEIPEDKNEVTFYSLAVGYYSYYATQTATYTLDNNQLSFVLQDVTYKFYYEPATDLLTIEDFTYTREASAPKKHPTYNFPDFANITFSGCSKLISADKVDVSAFIEEARLDIFHDYYSSSIEDYREITDRPARRGDYVNVDYIGYHNGIAFQGGSANASMISIIENSGYIPGFAEGIIGHTAGETFDVNVTFPENYGNVTLAGQPVTFKMTLNAIYDVTLNEEQFGSYENMEYATYEEYVIATAKAKASESIFTLLANQSGITDVIPDEAYMYFYQFMLDQAHSSAYYYNLDYATYLTYFGLTEASMKVRAKTVALDYIIAHHIAKTESLTWTDEQYQEKFDAFVDEMTKAGYKEADAIEFVTKNQLHHVKTELTYLVASEWFVNQVFADE